MSDKPMSITDFARMGGHARAKSLSPERRQAIAQKAGRARAKKAGQQLRKPRKTKG